MVSRLKIKQVLPNDLHLEILPAAVKRAFLHCVTLPIFSRSGWYLAGGTALGLQVGHRQSVDLDFFTPKGSFQAATLERYLFNHSDWATTYRENGTLYGKFMGAKMSFIAYPFFRPSNERTRCGTVFLLKPHDIAAMKILAISQRGRKRDFVDLYWHCANRESLIAVIKRAIIQYPRQENNLSHILKSLVYFTDAEGDPMPKLLFKAEWKTIKAYFRREVPKITKELLGLNI